jgi:hypothetical protein
VPAPNLCCTWLVERAIGDDPAVLQDYRAVDERSERSSLVQHNQHRLADGHKLSEKFGQRTLGLEIDPSHRFIKYQQVRFAGQRSGDQHALLLTAGKARHVMRQAVGEADHRHSVSYRVPIGLSQRYEQGPAGESTGRDNLLDGGIPQRDR